MQIDQILSLDHHCLHLCNNFNTEEIVFSSVMDTDVFVTANTEFWEQKFKEHGIDCRIKSPGVVKPEERIVVDGSSLGNKIHLWEEKWKKQAQVICIYNIDQLDPKNLKSLVEIHDKMLLSVNKVRILSDKSLENEMDSLNSEIIENVVKKELNNILLSFLLAKPMSGAELVKLLYQKYKVFVSPGTLYPTLHELEKKRLLKYEFKFKSKVYSVQKKEEAELLLKKHAKANSLVSQSLLVG